MREYSMKDVSVNYNEFTFSHGKMPRGTGSWAFAFSRNYKQSEIFWAKEGDMACIPFKQALKLAKEEALKRGSDTVYVLS